MSMKGISSEEPHKTSKKISFLKRNDAHSGELDVFEAAVYFSGDHRHTQKYGYNAAREENPRRRGRRISLDLPIRCSEQVYRLYQDHEKEEVTTTKEMIRNVRHKQPSSPGGKITSFLKSLFNQEGSKKNKSKSKSKPMDGDVEEEIPGGGWMRRRRRRSSISHSLSSSNFNLTKLSKSSGFRTPPPYLDTPTKNYKQFLNFTSATELSWLDEKLKVMESLTVKEKVLVDHDDDDGGGMESDSSSDLFELQNYGLSRGGLPVYETTSVANINNTHL